MTRLLRRIWSIRVMLIILFTPIILLPLPIYIGSQESKAAYVLIMMGVFWITEAVPMAVTGLLPVFMFPIMGVMKAKDIAPAYMSDTLMVFIGGLIMAIAIETWDLHKRLALRVLLLVGSETRWLMLGLMSSTWFLSMWVSNTATTAMMIPIAEAVLMQLKGTNKLLLTERKSDTDVLTDSHENDTICRSTVHEAKQEEIEDGNGEFEEDLHFKQVCKAISLSICYAANSGGLGCLTGTGPNLVVKGFADELFESHYSRSPINFSTWMGFGLPLGFMLMIITWIWLQIFFLRCKDGCSCSSNGAKGKKVHTIIREQYDALGPTTFAQTTILVMFSLLVVFWISRDLGGAGGWGDLFRSGYVRDSTPSVFMAFMLFFVPSEVPAVFCNFKKYGRRMKTSRPLLIWRDVHEKMPWELLILLGGGFALAKGCEVSGLSSWVGLQLKVFADLNRWLMLLILCYICCFLTEFISNVALATLIVPILSTLALNTGVNPLFYIIPASATASFAFMLPVATAPNALVFSYGHIKVIDMVSAGFFLNIIAVPLLVFCTYSWGDAIFDLDTMPFSYNITNTSIIL